MSTQDFSKEYASQMKEIRRKKKLRNSLISAAIVFIIFVIVIIVAGQSHPYFVWK